MQDYNPNQEQSGPYYSWPEPGAEQKETPAYSQPVYYQQVQVTRVYEPFGYSSRGGSWFWILAIILPFIITSALIIGIMLWVGGSIAEPMNNLKSNILTATTWDTPVPRLAKTTKVVPTNPVPTVAPPAFIPDREEASLPALTPAPADSKTGDTNP